MSLNDKIIEIFEKRGSPLSTEDVWRILKDVYKIKKSLRTVERHVVEQLVKKEKRLVPDAPRGREQTYSLSKKSELYIAEASIQKSNVEIAGGRSLKIVLSLRSELETSTTIERVHVKIDEKTVRKDLQTDVPAGATRRIEIPSLSAAQLGKTWKEGGQISIIVVHTHGTESLSFETSPLYDKSLPWCLFSSP